MTYAEALIRKGKREAAAFVQVRMAEIVPPFILTKANFDLKTAVVDRSQLFLH